KRLNPTKKSRRSTAAQFGVVSDQAKDKTMTRNKRLTQDTTSRFRQIESVTSDRTDDQCSFRSVADAYARERGSLAAWIDPRLLARIGEVPVNRIDQT